MKKQIIMLGLIITGMVALAQDTIQGTYVYTYGDNESLVEARQTCKDLAVRDAIESYYVFVESSTVVENATLKEDIISTISAGYLKNLTVVDQTEEGRTISTTVEAEIDPEQVQALVQKMANASLDNNAQDADREDHSKTVSSSDQEDPLESLLSRYEKRMSAVEADWKNKNYSSAYSQVQEIQKYLEAYVPSNSRPFQTSLYMCVHKQMVLIKHLIRLEQAEQHGKRKILIRSQTHQVTQDAIQLREAIQEFRSLSVVAPRRKTLRDTWIRRCQATLERAKRKIKE